MAASFPLDLQNATAETLAQRYAQFFRQQLAPNALLRAFTGGLWQTRANRIPQAIVRQAVLSVAIVVVVGEPSDGFSEELLKLLISEGKGLGVVGVAGAVEQR